ncbi:hypothetical protein BH10PSE12_BH10PSE12_34800 [soil metagenome]
MASRRKTRPQRPATVAISIPHPSWFRHGAQPAKSTLNPDEFWARLGV